ncbi:protein kinase [Nannocystis sp. ncelm1]|uniref:Protein kinase n=1 Tax=Nannocystis radixulma TaxID=2995305 RepID=A0ABT5B1Z1_9BACT|nr:protein kinase [Nannocystis radixulma]
MKDRYLVLDELAHGGMGTVYLAKDRTMRSLVAIKMIHSTDPEVIRRFAAEKEVLGNVHHSNLIHASDFGTTNGGQPFMVLEYIPGQTLETRRLGSGGRLPWQEVVEVGIQLARALEALHAAGVIHRDVKPANAMVAESKSGEITVKLLDLGVAFLGERFLDAQDKRFTPEQPRFHTQLGAAVGTAGFLPAEVGYLPAHERLDVYGLAATLFYLCAGELPRQRQFGGITLLEVASDCGAPEALSLLLEKALAIDPIDRTSSVSVLKRGLEALLRTWHDPDNGPKYLFGGRFDLLGLLGAGATTECHRAAHRHMRRLVALKLMRSNPTECDDAGEENRRLRFRQGAMILAALDHPNIPQLYDYGVADGDHYAVVQLCDGKIATEYTWVTHHLRVDEAIRVGLQLADALAAIHSAGVIYRDLRPGNVIVRRGDGAIKSWLVDFDESVALPEFFALQDKTICDASRGSQGSKAEGSLE